MGSLKTPKKKIWKKFNIWQKAVNLQFNFPGEDNVTKAKQLMAEAIDLELEKDHAEKTDNGGMMSSWTRNVFRTKLFLLLLRHKWQ